MRGRRGGRQGRWQKKSCGQEKRMIFLPTELLVTLSPFKLENEARSESEIKDWKKDSKWQTISPYEAVLDSS